MDRLKTQFKFFYQTFSTSGIPKDCAVPQVWFGKNNTVIRWLLILSIDQLSEEEQLLARVLLWWRLHWYAVLFMSIILTATGALLQSIFTKEPYQPSILAGEGLVMELLVGHEKCIYCELGVHQEVFVVCIAVLHEMGHGYSRYVSLGKNLWYFSMFVWQVKQSDPLVNNFKDQMKLYLGGWNKLFTNEICNNTIYRPTSAQTIQLTTCSKNPRSHTLPHTSQVLPKKTFAPFCGTPLPPHTTPPPTPPRSPKPSGGQRIPSSLPYGGDCQRYAPASAVEPLINCHGSGHWLNLARNWGHQ